MEQPQAVEKLIGEMPKLDASRTSVLPPEPKDGDVALNAEQSQVAKLLGHDPAALKKTLAAERTKETI